MTTTYAGRRGGASTNTDQITQHDPDPSPDEERFRLTARGAVALGLEIDPERRGPIAAYSDELQLWVRFR